MEGKGAELKVHGYRVGRFTATFTRDALGDIDVLVISNALSAEKDEDWSLPTPAAFTEEEVDVVEGWVREGGRLMLIADHMPFPLLRLPDDSFLLLPTRVSDFDESAPRFPGSGCFKVC